MKKWTTLAIAALALAWPLRGLAADDTGSRMAHDPNAATSDLAPGDDAKPPDATNTGQNERDRYGKTETPFDQGDSEADVALTQNIRQGVMNDDALSTDAKNVKIISKDGVVVLRGPVASQSEKDRVASIASRAPGVKKVEDQLEVQTQR